MTYLLKHKETKKYKSLGILFCVFILLFSIFYFGGTFLSPIIFKVLAPASKFITKATSSMKLALKLFEPEASLIRKNQELERKIRELELKLHDYPLIQLENGALKEELGYVDSGFVVASILLSPPQMPYDSLLINRGSEDGVFVGARVFVSEKAVLGYAEEVFENTSRVRMFTSSGIKTSAVLDKDGTLVELQGRGGGNFFLEAPLSFDIDKGDIFVIPGGENIILGLVGEVKQESSGSLKRIFLLPPLKIDGHSKLLVQIE